MKYSEMHYERADIGNCQDIVNKLIEQFELADSAVKQIELIKKYNAHKSDWDSYESIAYVNYSCDTTNDYNLSEKKFWDDNSPLLIELDNKFITSVYNSKHKQGIIEEWGDHYFNLLEMRLKTFTPEIKDLLAEESKLNNEYTNLLSSAEINFQGETYNLTGLGKFIIDSDRDIRKSAVQAKYGFFQENKDALDNIYDQMVKVRSQISEKLDFKSYTSLAYLNLGRSDYSEKEVKFYREEIVKHIVPLVRKLNKKRKEILKLDKLFVYDGINYPEGDPKPIGTPEELVAKASKMYHELSPESGEFFDIMKNNELMDLVNRKGKQGGGFCTSFPKYELPFIFSNFNGTAGDITVLTHEAGHAFQAYQSRKLPLLEYLWPTMEACEIHSMSMEFITWPWMKLFFGENTEKFKFMHMSDSLSFLPYGAQVDHFQHWVYDNLDATPKQRKEKWTELDQLYRPDLDNDDISFLNDGGMWQGQSHIFNSPFYYIDYTLALICAFQFWIKFQEEPKSAWEDYLKLCKLGGSLSFTKLIKEVNIDSPFEKDVLKNVTEKINDWLNSIDTKNL